MLRQLLAVLALTWPLYASAETTTLTTDNCDVSRITQPIHPRGLPGCVIEVGTAPPDGVAPGNLTQDVSSLRTLDNPRDITFNLCASWPAVSPTLVNATITAMELDFRREMGSNKAILILSVDLIGNENYLTVDWAAYVKDTDTLLDPTSLSLPELPLESFKIPTCNDPWAKGALVKIRPSGQNIEVKVGDIRGMRTLTLPTNLPGMSRLKATQVRFYPFLHNGATGARFSTYWPVL